MASAPFVDLSGAIVQAMGQRLDAAKPTPEGLLLRTGDGFLYAFLEDPSQISLADIGRLLGGEKQLPQHLVVLSPGHLPLALAEEVVKGGGTLVEGARFAELARQLGLETLLGEGPRPAGAETKRLLPSAQHLDAIMHRARTWLDWGVPALALRFYRQASDLKPGFLPARIGIGRSLLALGLTEDAERTFNDVLVLRPSDVDARLGKASVLGARAKSKEEVEIYRTLLAEDEARTEVRAHLVAALIDLGDWASARVEIEAMLARTPEDPSLRFLRSVALERTGHVPEARRERREARSLGLSYEREVALCQHLGIAPPPPPEPAEAPPPPPRARTKPVKAARKPSPARAPQKPSRSTRPRPPVRKRK
ncbi:MAG TPA: tetratricopeptide repeat protein [Thermoplasmata archaeon]|nr:tetratricopeptide repeat protein [Thermoplasmata archaeon]